MCVCRCVLSLPALDHTNPENAMTGPRQNTHTSHIHTYSHANTPDTQDFAFFASGSDDGTVKIWELKGLDQTACPRAAITYARQARFSFIR